MALVFNRNSVGIKATGLAVTVPDHPKARLMYYLNCMCNVLSLNQTEHNIVRLTDYHNYHLLTNEETAAMVLLCTLLDPVSLNDVCIFHEENACGSYGNEFFEINARRTTIAAAQSIMVGNVRVAIKKIMCYKMSWLEKNYIEPLGFFSALYQNASRQQQRQIRHTSRPTVAYIDTSSNTYCCSIL